jgi:hypothetical protein
MSFVDQKTLCGSERGPVDSIVSRDWSTELLEMIGKGLEVFFLIDLFHLRTTSVPVPSPSKDCNSCSDTSVIGM